MGFWVKFPFLVGFVQSVYLCQEGTDVGCLMVCEVVVLFERGPRLGESVVSFTIALSFCFAFLLFRLVGWVIRWV